MGFQYYSKIATPPTVFNPESSLSIKAINEISGLKTVGGVAILVYYVKPIRKKSVTAG
jgi:hypothetical protein